MKKKILICSLLLIACISIIGCTSKNSNKDKSENEKIINIKTWETNQNPQNISIRTDAAEAYNLAMANESGLIIPLALIAKNEKDNSYMLLCNEKKDNQTVFKIVIIKSNNNKSAKIDKNVEFDYEKIIKENDTSKKSNKNWKINTEAESTYLDENLLSAFVNATFKEKKNNYTAISYIASSNNIHAFLCIDNNSKNPEVKMVIIEIGEDKEATIIQDIPIDLNELY